jgi:hypothetical protein
MAGALPCLAGLVWAQTPKGAAGPATVAKPGLFAPKTPKTPPSDSGAKPPSPPEIAPEGTRVAPEVQAVLDLRPTTPSELIRAGRLLADLKRPDLARGFFKRALAAAADPKALSALAEEFGSQVFLELKTRRDLAPEAPQLANAVLQARTRQLQDPQRLAALIQDLGSASVQQRLGALMGLQEGGEAAVRALIAVLADPQRAGEHAGVRAALIQLGPAAMRPLVTVLQAKDPKLVAEAIQVIGAAQDPRLGIYLFAPLFDEKASPEVRAAVQAAVVQLLGAAPTRQLAARQLAEAARLSLDRSQPLAADTAGQVTVWTWDEPGRQPVAQSVSADQAGRWFAARFARDAYTLLPGDAQIRRLYLVAMLEEAAYQHGLDNPLPMDNSAPAGKAAALGAGAIEDALAYAMEHGHAAAAAAAARILGWQPDADKLLHRPGQPCPLVRAAQYPDPRVRLAAVEAIVRIRPQEPYPGASHVVDALGYFIASRGARRAIVASPSVEESQRVSGYLAAMGFEVDWGATGAELIRLALRSPDYELAMVDAGIDRPTLQFAVQQLRRDGRTALLPLGIFARDDQFDQARHVAEGNPRAEAFYRPHEQAAAEWQAKRVLAMAGPDAVGAAQRRQQAASALEWIAQLCGDPSRRFYDLRRVEAPVLAAMHVPDLCQRASAVLGTLGTAESQRALVDLASRGTAPLADRVAALSAFRQSTEKYGVLLTIPQIRLQYDRYNQSANQDGATRKILGLILDCIEAPTQAAERWGHRTHQQGSTAASVIR